MNDNDFIKEKLRVIDEVEIPESISPANMVAKLKAQKAEKKSYPKITVLQRVVLVAAAIALFVTGTLSIGRGGTLSLDLPTVNTSVENVKFFNSNDEVIDAVRDFATRRVSIRGFAEEFIFYGVTKDSALEYTTVEDAIPETADLSGTVKINENDDHSTTNLQEQGVMEADIAVTDGKYIYTLSTRDNKIRTVDVQDKTNPKVVSEIDTEEHLYNGEFYVVGDKLVLNVSDGSKTSVHIYDISDRTKPVLSTKFSQDGYYNTSRLIDGVLYLVSVKHNYRGIYVVDGFEWFSDDKVEEILPCIEVNSKSSTIPASHTCVIGEPDSASFTVITALDVSEGEPINTLSVIGSTGTIYCSSENLYLSRVEYSQSSYDTVITKISLNGGEFEVTAQGSVNGSLLNQFSLGEYQGNLRVVTTSHSEKDGEYDSENNVYILNEKLETVGKLEGLARGERIYSARFMGEKIYMVTFKETDPLFVIDASDPTAPVVLGELKIPGFSNYLHPFGENMLIGLGEDVEVDERYGTLRAKGIKLSLFDVNDPTNPIEVDAVTVGGPYSYSDAQYNHKAILFDAKRSIIGFPCQNFDNKYDCYIVFRVSENGFEPIKKVSYDGLNGYNLRGLTIGDTLFTVGMEGISVDELFEDLHLSDIKY